MVVHCFDEVILVSILVCFRICIHFDQNGISFLCTVQAAKRLYPSRLQTWNFASHVTFLRGFCEEVAWVLHGISVSFAKFCEIFSSSVESKRETVQL